MMSTAILEQRREDHIMPMFFTERFGDIEVVEEKIIEMTNPLLGFSDSRRFVLLPHSETSPFMWFQSLDNPSLAFVVLHPSTLNLDYQPALDHHVRMELQLSSEDEPDTLVILTIPQGRPKDMTANLLGPLMINVRKRLAKQVVLDPTKYDPCWPVFAREEQG